MRPRHPDDDLDYDEEEPKRPRPGIRCGDRTCGALDCPTCYPLSWWKDAQPEEPEPAPVED